MSKGIGFIVAGGTVAVGGGVGVGVYFALNKDSKSGSETKEFDFAGVTNNCTINKCGDGALSITQSRDYNNGYFLNLNEMQRLYDFWTQEVTHGPEIAFFKGIDLSYKSGHQDSNGVVFGSYSWYSKKLNLFSNGYGKNFTNIPNSDRITDKVKFFKYTLTHEYGHHLTQWYFKNGIDTNNRNKTYTHAPTDSEWTSNESGKILQINNSIVDKYLALRGLDSQAQFTDCNPYNKTNCSKDNSYYLNLLEWLTRDFSYLTQNYIDEDPVMKKDNNIRDGWGIDGGNQNITTKINELNKFYKDIIGFSTNGGLAISSVAQSGTQKEPYSSLMGFTQKKYDCIVAVDGGNNILKKVKTHYNDDLLNFRFRNNSNAIAGDKPTTTHPYITDMFTPDFFSSGSKLKFTNDCNNKSGIEEISSDSVVGDANYSPPSTLIAGQGQEYFVASNEENKFFAPPTKGRVEYSVSGGNQEYIYRTGSNDLGYRT